MAAQAHLQQTISVLQESNPLAYKLIRYSANAEADSTSEYRNEILQNPSGPESEWNLVGKLGPILNSLNDIEIASNTILHRRNKPINKPLAVYVLMLSSYYSSLTGRKATLSDDSVDDPTGPFVKFVSLCIVPFQREPLSHLGKKDQVHNLQQEEVGNSKPDTYRC